MADNQKINLLPPKKDENELITCFGSCGRKRKLRYFFRDLTGTSAIGVIPYCKDCCKDMCLDERGKFSEERFLEFLKNPVVNRPFFQHIWDNHKNAKDPLGNYFKALSASPKIRNYTWEDGDKNIIANGEIQKKPSETVVDTKKYIVEIEEDDDEPFIITEDMVRKWGVGFEPDQYIMLEELYDKLSRDFEIDTGVQEEYLQNACICQMRNKVALALGNVIEAGNWGKQFDSYMASGKLKPNQISNSDKMGGITNFSTFFQYVEKSENFIPDFPDIMIDDIDYAIYTILNYVRKLFGVAPITLGEVKDFTTYDYERGQEIIFPDKKDGKK